MATPAQWFAGMRPKTLPAAIAPVLVGSSIAIFKSSFRPTIAVCALIVALALQIGVNFANDYSDGIRGTDEARIGPVRLVGQKLASPTEVKRAAFLSFAFAVIAGLLMTLLSGYWILIPVGITAVIAAWFYTGGAKPYGYAGFGELFVFAYFGLVAVIGTSASQTGSVTLLDILAGTSCGLISCAILIANNLRDTPSDTKSGKRTLAVRLGDSRTRHLYQAVLIVGICLSAIMSAISSGPTLAWIACSAIFLAVEPMKLVKNQASGPGLIPVLASTGRLLLMYSIILSCAIAFS